MYNYIYEKPIYKKPIYFSNKKNGALHPAGLSVCSGLWSPSLEAIVSDLSVFEYEVDDDKEGTTDIGDAGDDGGDGGEKGGGGGDGSSSSTSVLPTLRLHVVAPPIDQLTSAVPSLTKRYHVCKTRFN